MNTELIDLAKEVLAVLEAQQKYFSLRRKGTAAPSEITNALDHSKGLERELKAKVEGIIKTQHPQQKQMF